VVPQNSLRYASLTGGATNMASSAFGVAWYQGKSGLYYEVTADGKVSTYPGLSSVVANSAGANFQDVASLVLTDNGTVIISAIDITSAGNNGAIFALDRTNRTWAKVPVPSGGSPSTLNLMFGGDGNTIAMQTADSAGLGLRFFNVAAH
jgi:hypothetical protein